MSQNQVSKTSSRSSVGRPKNSTKPLYQKLPTRAGRPSQPKKSIGLIGPSLKTLSSTDLRLAFDLGREIAKHGHLLVTLSQEGISQAATRGCRYQSGLNLGYSPARNAQHHLDRFNLPSQDYDHLVFTNSTWKRTTEQFIASLDGLVIMPSTQLLTDITDSLQKISPQTSIGLTTDSSQQISWWQELQNSSHISDNPVFINHRPRSLIADLLNSLKSP